MQATPEMLAQLLGPGKANRLVEYSRLLLEWNVKINLISRKESSTVEDVLSRHVLPCMAFPLAANFQPDETVLDVGTGGGLPGLVSAICAPETRFTLVDLRRKKIMVVSQIAKALSLKNVLPLHEKAENLAEKYDFVTGRGVTSLPRFVPLVTKNLRGRLIRSSRATRENGAHEVTGKDPDCTTSVASGTRCGPGILYMKGGDIQEEVEALGFAPQLRATLDRWIPGYDDPSDSLLHFPTQ
ncbi:rsmG [Symbiodinium natans]|uniref:RsmG protein n=1 Tax=Symbiodinium natans TaxID=878477 RepID=A0A812PZD1_9DINO|nr:rsmG [Symbiodinium natans]